MEATNLAHFMHQKCTLDVIWITILQRCSAESLTQCRNRRRESV